MINVLKIGKSIIKEGKEAGFPCVSLVLGEGKEMSVNDILEEILKLSLPRVAVKGVVKDTPELKDVLVGLSLKAKKITLITSGEEVIESLRSIRNLDFFLNLELPTAEYNQLAPSTLGYLRPKDEVKVIIKSLEEYKSARKFFGSKPLLSATIIFAVSPEIEKEEYIKIAEAFISSTSAYPAKFYAEK